MNSVKQCMNSAKQYINSKFIWDYCSHVKKKKKKKKAENVDTAKRQETRKPNTHIIKKRNKLPTDSSFVVNSWPSFLDYRVDSSWAGSVL